MFWWKDFWIITLVILLIVYILGKSKHLIELWNCNIMCQAFRLYDIPLQNSLYKLELFCRYDRLAFIDPLFIGYKYNFTGIPYLVRYRLCAFSVFFYTFFLCLWSVPKKKVDYVSLVRRSMTWVLQWKQCTLANYLQSI